MSYEEWVERWQLQQLNDHLLTVYGDEDESDDEELCEEEI